AGLGEQAQLGVVELAVDRTDLGVRLLAVEGRVDVPPAGQQEAVQVGERTCSGGQVDGLGADGLHGPLVGDVIVIAPTGARGDPDSGPRAGSHLVLTRLRARSMALSSSCRERSRQGRM